MFIPADAGRPLRGRLEKKAGRQSNGYDHLCIFTRKSSAVVERTQCGGKSFIASSIVEEPPTRRRIVGDVSAHPMVSL